MIDTLLCYMAFASAPLVYGIGLDRATSAIRPRGASMALRAVKGAITILCSVSLSWVIVRHLLVPASLVSLCPLVALLVFTTVSSLVEVISRLASDKRSSEFSVSYLVTLLALCESVSIIDALAIAVASMLSFALLSPVLRATCERGETAKKFDGDEKRKSFAVVAAAVAAAALCAWDVSWLNGLR